MPPLAVVSWAAMTVSVIGTMAALNTNIKNVAAARLAKAGGNKKPMPATKLANDAQRMICTRRPVRSASAPQAYGANSRVQLCKDTRMPMATTGSPISLYQSGAYGLKPPMAAK